MQKKKYIQYIVIVLVISMIGGTGYAGWQLKKDRDNLAFELDRSENRNKLLEQKYKEQKAQTGRLQREKLMLNGKIRQAQMDAEKYKTENERLVSEMETIEDKFRKQLVVCENEKDAHDKLKAAYSELKDLNLKTTHTLREREAEVAGLTADLAERTSELKRTIQMNKRYVAHNEKLSSIAQTLVGRVEKQELGSTILVKEPLIQYERVELEELLQTYLDKIDDEKVIQ